MSEKAPILKMCVLVPRVDFARDLKKSISCPYFSLDRLNMIPKNELAVRIIRKLEIVKHDM